MFRTFVAIGLLSSYAIPAFAAADKKPTQVAVAKAGVDCTAHMNHFNDLAWADFLKNEGKGMTATELAASKAMFPGELAAQPEVKQMASECKSGKLAKRTYDCQMKAKTLDAFDDCSG